MSKRFLFMRNILLIGIGAWICFIVEYFLSEWFSPWLRPNIILILLIFFNLYRGIRHSFLVAFLGGMIKDSFAATPFGLNILTFLICAYFTTLLKMYIYEATSSRLRIFLIFIISILCVLTRFWIRLIFVPVDFWEVFRHILLPEVFATTVISLFAFRLFKQCALKLFA